MEVKIKDKIIEMLRERTRTVEDIPIDIRVVKVTDYYTIGVGVE